MTLWYKIKYYGGRFMAAIKRLMARIAEKVNAAFPSTKAKLIALVILVIVELLLAYLIAIIQIGMWNGIVDIWELIDCYIYDDYQFPLLLYLIITIALIWIALWIFDTGEGEDTRNFQYSDSDVYGSAGEISMEDLRKVADVMPIESLPGTILGQLDMTGKKVIGIPPNPTANKNLLVIASPGQGKSFSVVENQIMQALRRGESVVCTDTKGEVRAKTAEPARYYGYIVKNLNLKNTKYSDGWAVLKELRCDDDRADIFIEIIAKNTGNPTDPHLGSEQLVLKACCLYVERNPLIPDHEKTFYKVFSMIQQGPAKLDEIFEPTQYDANLRIAYDSYVSFKTGSDNLRANVIQNLASRLKSLSSPAIQLLTAMDDIDLTLPGKKKCIYYITLSDQHETMKFLATLFFTFLFLDLGDYADAQPKKRLPVPVNVILEEMANIGEIVGLKKYMGAARGRAISITLICQALSQIPDIYGDKQTDTILTCCGIHACLGTMDRFTAEHFAWLSGVATVEVDTEQHDINENPLLQDFRHSTGHGRRDVYTSNEIRKLKQGEIMLGWMGYDTLICRTFGIIQHPEYKMGHMTEIPDPCVPIQDTEARAYLRAMEEQRVLDYEEWENDGGYAWEGYDYPPPKCNGPSRGKPKPKVIPYPELERMALEYAAQAKAPESMKAQSTPASLRKPEPPSDPVATQPVPAIVVQATPPVPAPPKETPAPELSASVPVTDIRTLAPAAQTTDDNAALPVAEMPSEPAAPQEAPEVPASVVPAPAVYRDKKTAPKTTQPKRSGSGTLYATKIIKRDTK